MITEDKIIDKNLFIKYLIYLIDYSTQILESYEFGKDEYEALIKEHDLFMQRLNRSDKIDINLKNELIKLNLQSDITAEPESIQAIRKIMSIFSFRGMPMFRNYDSEGQLIEKIRGNIKEYRDRLSNILFKLNTQA